MPSSSQIRNALAYMAVTVLVLVFLNIYSASASRDLMFKAKCSSAQDKLKVVTSSFSGVDALTQETAEQIIAVIGDMNVTRLIVTDASGRALYDSVPGQNAEGKFVLLEPVVQALGGSDFFHCVYENSTLKSYAASPVLLHDTVVGCVYLMEYDASQGSIIASLERTIFRGSLVLIGIIFLCAVVFTVTGSSRMRRIMTSMRLVREGEYSHKIQMRGSDEYATLAAEFNKLTDKLQQTEITERQFVSDASHELKTPLASIKLLSDSILQNEMDADTMREFVADIGAESDRLTRMAQKLLTLSRASADETEGGEHEVVDVGQTLSRVFRMLVPLADRQSVKLTASVEKGCTILSFEDDAYQILFNLVENGIKYNRENGSVHVRVRQEDDTVVIDVEDTGSGIPENALDSIFNRFYRVDKARSRQAFFSNSLLAPDSSRTMARHTVALSFADILAFAARHLAEDGEISAIIPTDCMESFSQEAFMRGMFQTRLYMIKTVERKPAKRCLIAFSKSRPMTFDKAEVVLMGKDGKRSDWYDLATREFYL